MGADEREPTRSGAAARKAAEDAAYWVARLHSDQVTGADEARFCAWLAEQPEHRAAYDDVEQTWRALGALRNDPETSAALGDLRDSGARAPLGSRRALLGAGAGAIAAAAGAGFYVGVQPRALETGFGEVRRASLEDGSVVSLNTETRLRVRFDSGERRIWLDRGQAHFAVAHDPSRPFRVFVGDEEVRALGTAFEVRRDGDRMTVILVEGVVALYHGGAESVLHAEPDLVLEPGQEAVAEEQAVRIVAADRQRVSAWRYGQMIFNAEPLSAAVAEINRYHHRQIVLADPALGDIAISGVFQTGRPEAFVDVLTSAFEVDVAAQDERTIRLAPRNGRQTAGAQASD